MNYLGRIVLMVTGLVIAGNTAPSYQVLYNEWFTVNSRAHVFKIIKIDKPDNANSNFFYLVGEAHAKQFDFNIYLLDAENYEVFTSGENPQSAFLWMTKVTVTRLIVGSESQFTPLQFGKKYYLVIDNNYSMMTDKEVRVFLLAFWD